ncbi:UDP-N-acetylglucosamine transporter YEA4 [Candida viswanathii]|uniref:UDP-N-acetylglucosamine transporter YEA4 n=1 Tax=Candida viswanathii TaxID=5486 RepID=A0A367YNY5_9ASCO|nr:UDP-N-acetylglucosamine transporter YEA4 [Candida viswanathii]
MRRAISYISISEWLNILVQVFGGCCTNVFVLKNLLSNNDSNYSLGTLITFSQFLTAALLSVPFNSLGFIKPKVPMDKWFLSVALYFVTSLLNNLVWQYDISIPTHIIFRSSGTVVTMIVGYLFGGKRYNKHQIISSIIITLGTIKATLPEDTSSMIEFNSKFLYGISILLVACIISAFMGLYSEQIYRTYGNQWHESLFYNHFLGLPLFLFVSPTIYEEIKVVMKSEPLHFGAFSIPKQVANLVMNVSTQYLCSKGVNMLAGNTSALTVTVVLLVRKFISLILSVLWYGNTMSNLAIIGSIAVFGGAAYYSLSGLRTNKTKSMDKKHL